MVTDACGKTAFSALETGVAGDLFEVTESGFIGGCGTAGGYLHIVIELDIHAQVVSPPYKYEGKGDNWWHGK